MEIKTKYSIGDMVKVISPTEEEFIVSITCVEIRITERKTRIVYYSKDYTDIQSSFITGEEELTEVEFYEDNKQEGNHSYIKCKVRIVEEE